MGSLVDVINAPFMITASLITLFALSPSLTLFSLLVFPVMGGIISWVGKSLKRKSKKAQEELGNLFSIVDETLKSSKIIKIFNADIMKLMTGLMKIECMRERLLQMILKRLNVMRA
jgi:subfamily B ATP-binding cassette protein MsbA